MRQGGISIGMLMGIVGVVAVQIAVLRYVLISEGEVTALFVIPVVTALGLGALIAVQDLYRKGETAPFLVGFGIFGGFSLCFAVQLSPLWFRLAEPVARLFRPLFPSLSVLKHFDWILLIMLCSFPILLLAVTGGLLANAIGLTLVIKRKPVEMKA
jgi:hypothetical protein